MKRSTFKNFCAKRLKKVLFEQLKKNDLKIRGVEPPPSKIQGGLQPPQPPLFGVCGTVYIKKCFLIANYATRIYQMSKLKLIALHKVASDIIKYTW